MNQYFSASGYTMTDTLVCVVNGSDIYQTDYTGNRRLIGKTQAAYEELEGTTKQYYDKLVELGVITPPKTQEEIMSDMQGAMMEMIKTISTLSDKIKELESNGLQNCSCGSEEDIPGDKPKRGVPKSGTGDKRDGGQS